jgi:type 1 glutamine amidotransferase
MKKTVCLSLILLAAFSALAAPKKLLVVTTTTGFRHTSIPTLEKMLSQLATNSGEFTVEFVQQPPGKPANLKKDATEADKAAFKQANEKWLNEGLKPALQKLSPENLKHYDAVVFASTTGDLPLPDKQGFLDWIKAGHGFIGIHAASDTFHGYPEFIEMLGGEFMRHGPQVGVECINKDPEHPANAKLGPTWKIAQEEIYEFKNYDPARVHDLLVLDKHPQTREPGEHPVSWARAYGAGRVFYTSLGHREDVIDPDPTLKDRKNGPETSQNFQAHVLGGIEWATGLKSGQPKPPLP